MVINMFCMQEALYAAKELGVIFDKFSPEEFLDGLNLELEHGFVHPDTNVTNNNLILTAKIALAHLNEFPNYYNKEYGLKIFEQFLRSKMSEDYFDSYH